MLSELLVTLNIAKNTREASRFIKSGSVYLNGLRCANTDLHLVLIAPCALSIKPSNGLTAEPQRVILQITDEGYIENT